MANKFLAHVERKMCQDITIKFGSRVFKNEVHRNVFDHYFADLDGGGIVEMFRFDI